MAIASKQTTELLNKIANDLQESIAKHARPSDEEAKSLEKIHKQMHPHPKDVSRTTVSRHTAYVAGYHRMH